MIDNLTAAYFLDHPVYVDSLSLPLFVRLPVSVCVCVCLCGRKRL